MRFRMDDQAGAKDLADPQARVGDDDIGPAADLKGPDPRVSKDGGRCRGRRPDRVHQRYPASDRRPEDVEQVGRAAGDGPHHA